MAKKTKEFLVRTPDFEGHFVECETVQEAIEDSIIESDEHKAATRLTVCEIVPLGSFEITMKPTLKKVR